MLSGVIHTQYHTLMKGGIKMSLSDRVQVFSEKLGANVDVCIGYSESYFSETDIGAIHLMNGTIIHGKTNGDLNFPSEHENSFN